MKIAHLKISQILYAGFGLLVAVYLVSSALNAELMRRMHSNLDAIENTHNAQIAIAQALHKSVSKISLSVRKIVLEAPGSVAEARVSGQFVAGDTEAFVAGVQAVYGLKVVARTEREIRLAPG